MTFRRPGGKIAVYISRITFLAEAIFDAWREIEESPPGGVAALR
jgi:hypothetical protein